MSNNMSNTINNPIPMNNTMNNPINNPMHYSYADSYPGHQYPSAYQYNQQNIDQPQFQIDPNQIQDQQRPRIKNVPLSSGACENCGATTTPLWRRSPQDELLCNACGLYLKLHNQHRNKVRYPLQREVSEAIQCFNCDTVNTPLWRRDGQGNMLCNACGLYLKLHGTERPMKFKSDLIRKRQRFSNESQSKSDPKSDK